MKWWFPAGRSPEVYLCICKCLCCSSAQHSVERAEEMKSWFHSLWLGCLLLLLLEQILQKREKYFSLSRASPVKLVCLSGRKCLNAAQALWLPACSWCWAPHAAAHHNQMDGRVTNSNTEKLLRHIPSSFAPRDSGAWTRNTFWRSVWLWAKSYSKMP